MVAEDFSLEQLLEASSKGDHDAQYELGVRYEQGRGVSQDVRQAAREYRKAAEAGHIEAQLVMAKLCLIGKGVPQDAEEAAQWYIKAAVQGDAVAQFYAGEMHACGRGVTQDHQQAMMWYRKAAQQGHVQSTARLAIRTDDHLIRLTPEDRLDIQELTARYAVAMDHGDSETWLNTWADWGVWEGGIGTYETKKNLGRLLTDLGDRIKGKRHIMTNSVITAQEGGALQTCYMLVVEAAGEPRVIATGVYEDLLQKVDGNWKFVRRKVKLDSVQPPKK